MPGGRPPKSITQHKLDGTYRADRHANTLAGEPIIKVPKLPPSLDAEDAREWRRICSQLIELGILCPIDLPQIERYFHIRRIYFDAKKLVESLGLTITVEGSQGQTREITNPSFGIMMETHRHMLQIEERYGFSPVGRRKITIDPTVSNPEDKIGDTLTGHLGGKWNKIKAANG